jgi:spore coat protein A, manganese oxidase
MPRQRSFRWYHILGIGLIGLSVGVAQTADAAILDPNSIPKYVDSLVIPPVMPKTSTLRVVGTNIDYYEIAVRQFNQQILPTGMPQTPVWSYGSVNHPTTFNYPAFTIEATVDRPVRVKWINGLVDSSGNFLPHLLPVDQTIHWANPPGGDAGKDMEGTDPNSYRGPVPMITHVHGSHVTPESDGYPQAWYLPNANNIPAGYATKGTDYDQFDKTNTTPGTAVFQYQNDQRATTLWYHDHTLGMTRVNVYAGPAGFYLLRGGSSDVSAGTLPSPAPGTNDPAGTAYHEIPVVIQDRSFNDDGALFFPADRAFFEGLLPSQLQIPFIPDAAFGGPSDVSPIYNPEFFGNTMVTNGRTWPVLNVEPRRYRFRFLNGCNARTLMLKLVSGDPTVRPGVPALTFWQIGSEGGFLPTPVPLSQLLISLAERADVIVDFTGLAVGTELYLINEGPDSPFGGGVPGVDFPYADPNTTGQVTKFVVVPLTSTDTSANPATGALALPNITRLGAATRTRKLSLNELESSTVFVTTDASGNIVFDPNGVPFDPTRTLLGTLDANGAPNPLRWGDAITENPTQGDTEIWEIHNFTADAHPIHLHQVMFEVVNRESPTTGVRPPEAWETGFKDTVLNYPGEITRLRAHFDLVGLYVWHCHIIDHEDNEMMRPYEVVAAPPSPPTPCSCGAAPALPLTLAILGLFGAVRRRRS